MRIVNPTFGLSEADGQESESQPTKAIDWRADPIVLFSNSKPNARELLEGVREQMRAFRSVDNIDFVYKDSAGQPAPAELIDQVASNYNGALLALAD